MENTTLNFEPKWNCYEPKTDTEYHMSYDETKDTIWLVFRGSDGFVENNKFNLQAFKDWIQNGMAWNTPYKDMYKKWYVGWRHYGLFLKWKSIEDDVYSFIYSIYHRLHYMPIIKIRGYSQGAALAVFCNEYLYYRFFEHYLQSKINTIVAGCPKLFSFIGFKNVKERINNIAYCIYKNDMITKIPWWNRLAGKFIIANKTERKWYRYSVKDHDLENYKKLGWKNLLWDKGVIL